ncbi:MAG: hypothetical protein L6Q74_17820 [Sphaerotilus natans subsp. sulfidivorans]|uniref:hypothetical protein n=1 Tax=Sphaerotilus sulfidivorans TaxID=639200 RepID=UPI002356F2FE|nr:hypothetical protein [Sphaerotilus sulfidivorans]MCK6403736.1 hypothetical protein [Sphaerotilus sulfidivorans]
MALYRCNRCGHLSEQADELIGSSMPCPSCRTDNAVYPTVRFVQSMLTRYFAARRDLTAARAEIETLRQQAAEAAQAGSQEAPPSVYSMPMDFDPTSSDHFCSKVQVAPVLDWLRQHQATVDLDPRALDTSGPFDAIAGQIAEQPRLLGEIIERVRSAQKQDYSFINLDLSRRTPEDACALRDFCQELAEGGLLAKYLSQPGDPVVRLSLHRSVENRRFFEGGWLEWWSFMLALRHLLNVGADFSVGRDIGLSWPKDDGHKLDALFLLDSRRPLALQCLTGDPAPHVDRLLHLRDRLGIDPAHYLLCAADLSVRQAESLTQRTGLPVATLDTLKPMLRETVRALRQQSRR